MISTNEFKTGMTIEIDGNLWNVVEFLHVKPGKGSAFVKTKLKKSQIISKTRKLNKNLI